MAFSPITGTEIQAGKPVTTTTQGKIKDNFDDHESRLLDLESGTAVAYPPIIMKVNGPYGDLTAIPRLDFLTTMPNFNITILGVRLFIEQSGASGDTEIMLRRIQGPAYTTSDDILTAGLSVNFSDGDDFLSSNASLDPGAVDVDAGDLIRLDITSVQPGGVGFFVRIDYEKRV